MKKTVFKCLKIAAVAVFWIGIWYLLYLVIDNSLLFPSMHHVLIRLAQMMSTSDFYITVAQSILRIFIGLVVAVILGALLAIPSAKSRIVHMFLSPLMTVLKATPVASFIILLLLWIGRDIAPAIISVCVVLPIIWTGVETGITETDKELMQMAKVYNMGALRKVRYIYVPQVMPYFISSIRSSIGLAWKAGIAAEVLSLPLISIGKQIFESKLNLETVDLFAWTLVAIVISVVIEKLMVVLVRKATSPAKLSYERRAEI